MIAFDIAGPPLASSIPVPRLDADAATSVAG
jgi:hypothetical protein